MRVWQCTECEFNFIKVCLHIFCFTSHVYLSTIYFIIIIYLFLLIHFFQEHSTEVQYWVWYTILQYALARTAVKFLFNKIKPKLKFETTSLASTMDHTNF